MSTAAGIASSLSYFTRVLVVLVTIVASHASFAVAPSVTLGQTTYAAQCASCHTSPNTPAASNGNNQPGGHEAAANNPSHIVNAINVNVLSMNTAALRLLRDTPGMLESVALYMGQFKTPTYTGAAPSPLVMRVRSAATGQLDIYPFIAPGVVGQTGSGAAGGTAQDSPTEGLTRSATFRGATTAVAQVGNVNGTMRYNIDYTPPANFPTSVADTDSFTVSVTNPITTTNRTVSVTVIGITSAATASTGFKGNLASVLYTATCNGCQANTFSLTNLSVGLAASINSSTGAVTVTPNQTGVFNMTVNATTTGATLPSNDTVSKVVQVTIQGVNALTPLSFTQNAAITPANDFSASSTLSGNWTLDSPIPGLSFDTVGQFGSFSGIPTTFGSFVRTVSVQTTAGLLSQSFTIDVVSAGAPVVTTNMPASPSIAGTVNASINGSNFTISGTNPPVSSYSAVADNGLGKFPGYLPPGLSFNANGTITGIPTESGDFDVILRADNGAVGSLPFKMRIRPITAPVLSGANPAAVNVNATLTPPYQIVASNKPITSYQVVGPSVLPDGLSLDAQTGVISGAPSASGIFTTSVSASNLTATGAATSAPQMLTFTVNPTVTPGITSPTFANLVAGLQINPIQIVASNPAIQTYTVSGLPPGLTMPNNTTGVIIGTPSTPGSYPVSISASNNAGAGGVRIVNFTVGVPAPTACVLSVPVNTSATLDLASCLFGGFAPTGATIVSAPAHGAAALSGTRVTYTPVRNYFGGDSFTYVGSGAGGNSPLGTVTVTVTGRPDPTQDTTVVAVVAAQVETAQRFSRAQLSNFQRRMEALHRPPGAEGAGASALRGAAPAVPGAAFSVVAPGASFAGGAGLSGQIGISTLLQGGPAGGVTANTAPMAANPIHNANAIGAALALPRTIGSEIIGQNNNSLATRLENAAQPIREAEALNALVSGTGLKALPFSDSVISLIKSRSVDLASLGTAAGLNTTPDKTGKTNYWIEGVASFGTRDASGGFASSEFSSNGISIGVDQRINDQLAWGMGLGYGRDKTTIGTDGSLNRARGYSLAVYGSYQVSPNTYLDGLLGVGVLDFDSTRFVAPAGAFAVAERNGTQVFGSLTGGYEFRDRNMLISPYGRFDFASSRLGSGSETGAGAFALTYFGQTTTSVQGALGVRAESAHATSFGYAIPRVRAELRHEFKGNSQAFVGYADGVGGRFAIASAGGSRDSITLGMGSEFLMRDGLSLSLDYQLNHSFGRDSSYAVRLRLSKDFDARGLPKLRLAEPEREEEPLNIQFDAGYTTDDNVTRAKTGPDRLHDDFYSFNLGRTFFHNLSDTSRLLYGGTLGGQKFHRFNGLSNLQAGLELEYQYRASSEFDEPTYGVFGKLTGEAFESALRDGYRLSTGVSVRLPLSDRIGLFAAASYNLRNARSDVFSTRDKSLRANLDYALSDRETVYLGADFRYGDILSTGRASLENVTIAKLFVQDDVYAGGQLFSYKVDGRTVLLTAGYNLSFGAKDSVDFSWRHVRATPGLRPSFVTGPRSYKANQLSAIYLLRF